MEEYHLADVVSRPGDRIGANRAYLPPVAHEHTHDYVEVVFVVDGSGRHLTRSHSNSLKRGNVMIVRPGTWHAFPTGLELSVFNMYLAPDLFYRELSWVLNYRSLAFGLLRSGDSFGCLGDVAMNRVELWLEQIAAHDSVAREPTHLGLASCVLGELAAVDFGAPDGTLDAEKSPAIVRVLREIVADPTAQWDVARMALTANMSLSQFHRQFKIQVGAAPISWLEQLRGERAALLLIQSTNPISAVGEAVGWYDPNYFSRRFKLLYGVRPTEYRKRFGLGSPQSGVMAS